VLLDAASGQPAWLTVTGDGWDGALVVPLARARLAGGRVAVPYSSLVVHGAPRGSTVGGHLGAGHEDDLLRHYGLSPDPAAEPGVPATRREWRLPCTGRSLRGLRVELRALLDAGGLSGEERDDLVMAVSEAATNAVEHARVPAPGFFDVVVEIDDGRVQATVRDYGRWRDPVPGTGRGRGLLLMRSLSALTVTATPEGTTVTMENSLAARGSWSFRRRR
jgi:anti-sigma regulatory factor (Ser/Thr protein kinase)